MRRPSLSVSPSATTVLLTFLLPLVLTPSVFAQGEAEMREKGAKSLAGYAKTCFSSGFHRRAREVWLEAIHEYDSDHAESRKALGYLRVGRSWAEDSNFEYPEADKPDASAAKSLEKRWQKLCKDLGGSHRKLAVGLRTAGETARAEYHEARTLRFLPDDNSTLKQIGATSFEGIRGRPVEIKILERTRQMERRVQELNEKDFTVTSADEKSAVLDAGSVPYTVWESDNFLVFGDFEEELLKSAVQQSERALTFCQEFLVGDDAFRWPHEKTKYRIGYLKNEEDWKKVIQANASAFRAEDMAFILENARITMVRTEPENLRLGAFGGEPDVLDFAARTVAQEYSGLKTDAFREGIGHAIVGLFLGRNLIFTVAQEKEKEGTSTGSKKSDKRFEAPDLSIWKDLAAEAAWEHNDVKTARLPLLTADNFSSRARVKAWSICDYALRRDPVWMRYLDATASEHGSKNEGEVLRKFEELTKTPLQHFDRDWREFWTLDTPVMRAVRGDKTPLESVSKVVPAFLDAFNKERAKLMKTFKTEPVSWVADFSEGCQDHAEYLKANRSERGPAKEHTQDPTKKGYREAGREFAHRALVASKAKAKDLDAVVARWMDWPGYRDALLNRALQHVGVYGAGSIVVADVTRGLRGTSSSAQFPPNNYRGLGSEVSVAELGPEVQALLQEAGKKKVKVIGYPLTYHFYGSWPERSSIRGTLRKGGVDVPGFLHIGDGTIRRTSAPGLVTYYAFEPLSRGASYTMTWEFSRRGKVETFDVNFTTR